MRNPGSVKPSPEKAKMDELILKKTARRCRERGIAIPTFKQLRDPAAVPDPVKSRLKDVDMQALDPVNLFRIGWHNDIQTGLYGPVNFIELPAALTGVDARIVGLVGKRFPTGSHKVGAAFGCLVPRLVRGEFDPETQKAVWPSTGNYCRGGAFDSALLGARAVAILPEGMSRERFDWLRSVGAEIIATPGTESNVKEIYDKCRDIKATRGDCVIFNQFEEFGNSCWHYHVTGPAVEEVFASFSGRNLRPAGFVSATGSAGTIAAGDYLKKKFPELKIAAVEALQCPTLLRNGFGEHRIEGIGDKHVPWIHNVRNTDMVIAVDDEDCISLLRLFNEEAGLKHLTANGLNEAAAANLPLLGISGICNLLAAIKLAKYHELGSRDVVFTVFTDSFDMYRSRRAELNAARGAYTRERAAVDFGRRLEAAAVAHMRELSFDDRKALHNLKYFTWVEQQGRTSDELRRLWDPDFWDETYARVDEWDEWIAQFNAGAALSAS
jgi:cysteine synthase